VLVGGDAVSLIPPGHRHHEKNGRGPAERRERVDLTGSHAYHGSRPHRDPFRFQAKDPFSLKQIENLPRMPMKVRGQSGPYLDQQRTRVLVFDQGGDAQLLSRTDGVSVELVTEVGEMGKGDIRKVARQARLLPRVAARPDGRRRGDAQQTDKSKRSRCRFMVLFRPGRGQRRSRLRGSSPGSAIRHGSSNASSRASGRTC